MDDERAAPEAKDGAAARHARSAGQLDVLLERPVHFLADALEHGSPTPGSANVASVYPEGTRDHSRRRSAIESHRRTLIAP